MMRYDMCLEEMERRWIAHVPALLGCYASADDREAALALIPQAIRDYCAWRRAHGDASISLDPAIDVAVDEIVREWLHPAESGADVNAFFTVDAPALTAQDIDLALRLLDWGRADLLQAVHDLDPDVMSRPVEGEWNIVGILNHTGRSEWWYLDRLELAPTQDDPGQWRARLEMARTRLLEVLPRLEGVARIEAKRGETWSPRKMLRRALWHERDHTQHILQFRERLGV